MGHDSSSCIPSYCGDQHDNDSEKSYKIQRLRKQRSKHKNFDISVFKDEELSNCTNWDYTNCAAIKRLVTALKYYSYLNVKDDEKDREIFISFMETEYDQSVDDSNHFMKCHRNQLNEIRNVLMGKGECSMNGCAAAQRHFESERNVKNSEDIDERMNFYVNLMDSLHFIIFHCYDCGFRVEQNEQMTKEEEEDDIDDITLFEAELARINSEIRKRDYLTNSFERISPENNSKFTLSKTNQGDTFLDELYQHLKTKSMQIGKLTAFIDAQLYDSESMKMDALHYANIENNVNNKDCIQSIQQFIKGIGVQSAKFSVGVRFYYWPYYEKLKYQPMNEQKNGNVHDHGGYRVSELFVKPKFASFKEEISNYPNFNFEQYESVKIKAEKFMQSQRVKQISAKYTYHMFGSRVMLQYDIAFGQLVSFYHILALILYTDFSKLSTAFSASFRKIHFFEELKNIKQRNALYFWMSKHLRELVELFGQNSYGDTFDDDGNPLDALPGPFYCGMNLKLNLSEFFNLMWGVPPMRLNSPSSTSRQLAVAVKFSGPEGVVFTFDNPSIEPQYRLLRSFDCSYISHFREEDECLFFGGFYCIKVVNLRLIETKQNLKKAIATIYYFNMILSGGDLRNIKQKSIYFAVVQKLIKLHLSNEKNAEVSQLFLDTFHSFCVNKKQIILGTPWLHQSAEKFNHLLFYSLDKRDVKYEKETVRSDGDQNNLVRSDLLALFPNVTSLIIQSTFAYNSWSFSLLALLDVISGTNLDEIIIKSKEWNGRCWIRDVWQSAEDELWNAYFDKGYDIEMIYGDRRYNLKISMHQQKASSYC